MARCSNAALSVIANVNIYMPRSLYSEFVFVDVGPERKRFGVHKGLISKYSAFFQATFDGQFAEAFKGTVELLEETPSIFDVVHTWLYSLEITQIVNEKDVPCTAAQHLALCIFDDKYDMPLLFNDTIDLIITYYEDKSQPLERKHVPYIYDNTVQDSPLRKLIVAMFHCGTQVLIDSLEKKREFYTECPEFMFDLTMDLLCSKVEGKDGLWKAPCYKDRCQYHRHGYSDDECV